MKNLSFKRRKTGGLSLAAGIYLIIAVSGCYKEEIIDVPQTVHEPSDNPIDQYIQKNFTEKYGVAVRYKYVDRYVESDKRVTPIKAELVIPMLKFLESYWVEPFINVQNGNKFFKNHVPAEMVLIGSSIYNPDGTVTLGTADAGARITLTETNLVDTTNIDWVFRQLGTIYHEFGHIVHQRYNLPINWQQISPQGYTSAGSWYTINDDEALKRGFVSPYATSSYNEDFAEMVAHMLFVPDFNERYINDESCSSADCDARNEGRAKIRKKYNAILSHYMEHVGVDLLQVRELVQAKF
jgi:substrate import-associated zinc metallohydrolase lipoprotein